MSKKVKPGKPKRTATSPSQALSARKRRLFRCLLALLLPLSLLLVLELALRLFGYGYPTHFFLPSDAGRLGWFAENEKFGWRFFPRRLARAPDPIRLSRIKAPGTCRIFVLGESAALGDPQPAYGFSRILKELLEARCPGTKFEVINTAMTAINSHAIRSIARDCVPFHADFWIVYMGNNEVVGPFGAGSVFGAKAPPLPIIRAGLGLRRTCLGQAMEALRQRLPLHGGQPAQWEGMKMMIDQQIRAEDPVLERVYDHFRSNLNDIVSAAIRAGVKPIICSVSSNLKDCPPFASLHRPDLSPGAKAEFDAMLSAGSDLESRKRYEEALGKYRQAAEVDNRYAELDFRIARCCLTLGQVDTARDFYGRARDLDGLRFRADSAINRIIHEVCTSREADGVHYFASETAVTNTCRQGVASEECFWDHVHFNFRGNYSIAHGLAEQVVALLGQPARPRESAGKMLTQEQCAQRLAYTDWDEREAYQEMLRRIHEPPFTGQLDHEHVLERWSSLISGLDQKLDADGVAKAVAIYREALGRHPEDWLLHHQLAFLLEASGDLAGAAQEWQVVIQMVPECVEACYKLGDICARQSRPLEAELYYRRVLAIRPDSFEAMNGLALLLMDRGNLEEATRLFEQALRINPRFAQIHVNWGLLETRRGRLAAAEAHYREALRSEPDNPAAHLDLANLLATQQKHPEAIEHYLKALQGRSNESAVHFALANSLAAVGRTGEAVAQYQVAIRLNPAVADAHFNLGLCLAKAGDLSGAINSFQEAARLNPEDPQAHLNLGVALARQNRTREAIFEFEAVLRLEPGNATANQYLQKVKARAGQEP